MQNEVALMGNMLPMNEVINMGNLFFASGLFKDLQSAAQAIVKIQAGQELGIPPFASMAGIHIIQGKPTIGAGLLAAKVKASEKYDYEVVKHDATICSLDFFQGKKKLGNASFTAEEAKAAGTQ